MAETLGSSDAAAPGPGTDAKCFELKKGADGVDLAPLFSLSRRCCQNFPDFGLSDLSVLLVAHGMRNAILGWVCSNG